MKTIMNLIFFIFTLFIFIINASGEKQMTIGILEKPEKCGMKSRKWDEVKVYVY